MKTLFTTLLLIIALAGFSQAKDTVFTDIQGRPHITGLSTSESPKTVYYLDNFKTPFNGYYVVLDGHGQWTMVQEYDNGIPTGTWKRYHGKDHLVEITHYKDGKKDGHHIEYSHDKVIAEGDYQEGEPVGVWTYTDFFTRKQTQQDFSK